MRVVNKSAAILFLLVSAGTLPGDDEHSNRPAPAFSLPDSAGQRHDLAQYRGRVVLLDFMATGCPHCRTMMTALRQVEAAFRGQVAALSVVVPPDTAVTVQQFIREEG